MYYDIFQSPLGPVTLGENDGKLDLLSFGDNASLSLKRGLATTPLLKKAQKQILQYFERKRKDFDIPLFLSTTPFRESCWKSLQNIPYGEKRTYADQARSLGGPQYARAVGQANHHNPIAIIIPCHRIVSSSGALGGYAFGLDRKQWLLDLESS